MKRSSILLALAVCATQTLFAEAAPILEKPATGKPKIESINVLAFAPEGVLLVGDGRGTQVHAIDTGDTKSVAAPSKSIADFKSHLAGRLGAQADGVEIIDLAVNPASGKIYVAVRRQDDKQYVIVTVTSDGDVKELELDNIRHATVALKAGDSKVSNITDVAWADDRVIAAGRSNESFASKIFSVSTPLKHNAETDSFSAETYHVAHRRWETKAPMSVLIPYRENNKSYVIGAFSCTPVVKYELGSLAPGGKVKGESVLELGSGNRPIDMFLYEKDGKHFVLSNTFRFHHKRKPFGPSPYWTVKFEQSILGEDEDLNEKALRRLAGYKPVTERVEMIEAYHGVMQMDKLGKDKAVVLRQGEKDISLEVLPLP